LTGTKRWERGGDASSANSRSGMPLFRTLGAEAERLARISPEREYKRSGSLG